MHKTLFCGLALTAVWFSNLGCSNIAQNPAPGIKAELPRELSVYAVRKSITGTEYERYVLKDSVLFSECGKLSESAKVSDSSKDKMGPIALQLGRYRAERKSVHARELTRVEKTKLAPDIQDTLNQLNKNKDRQKDYPDLDSVGIFEVLVDQESLASPAHVLTSFDSVSDSGTEFNSTLRRLFKKLRSHPGSQCSETPFFGIGVVR